MFILQSTMGSIINKSNTFETVIYPESTTNESVVVDKTTETVTDIVESSKIEEPMERFEHELIKKLEQDCNNKLNKLGETVPSNASIKDIGDGLMNIMKSGADEFKEKTGRNMTYGEMRAAWG
jgi:hypothetical protein